MDEEIESGRRLLKREQPLQLMSLLELIRWCQQICVLWDFEYCNMSTGLRELSEELIRVCEEIFIRLSKIKE